MLGLDVEVDFVLVFCFVEEEILLDPEGVSGDDTGGILWLDLEGEDNGLLTLDRDGDAASPRVVGVDGVVVLGVCGTGDESEKESI